MVDPKIVNLVALGHLEREIDLEALKQDMALPVKYITGGGLYLRFEEDDPTITIARSGKYFITGANNWNELYGTKEKILTRLTNMGVIDEPVDESFSLKNMVCTNDFKIDIDLSALALFIGLESTEYEPEQFPGLIYRSGDHSGVALIFASGKIVTTGIDSFKESADLHKHVLEVIKRYHQSSPKRS